MSTEKKDFPQVEPQVSDVPKQTIGDKHLQKIVDKLGELTSSLANRLKALEATVSQNQGDQIAGFEKTFSRLDAFSNAFDKQAGQLNSQAEKVETLSEELPALKLIDSDLAKQIRALGDIVNKQGESVAKAVTIAESAFDRLDDLAQDEDNRRYYPALLNQNAPASLPAAGLDSFSLEEAQEWLSENYKSGQRAVLFIAGDIFV